MTVYHQIFHILQRNCLYFVSNLLIFFFEKFRTEYDVVTHIYASSLCYESTRPCVKIVKALNTNKALLSYRIAVHLLKKHSIAMNTDINTCHELHNMDCT